MKIFYQTYGEKNNHPLLFLHGFMGSHVDWEDTIEYFKKDFYCIAIDLPGHGQTKTDSKHDYTMESVGLSIILLLKEIHLNKINLVSYSMGGRLAFYLVVNYHENFDKVVIESATPGLKTKAEREQRILHDKKISEKLLTSSFPKFIDDWYSLPLFQTMDKSSPAFTQLLKRRLQNDPEKLALSLQMMGTGIMPSLWSEFEKIKSDILLIVGQKDSKFCNIASEASKLTPKVCLEIIKDAGHNVHFDQKNKFVESVNKFLLNK